MEGTAIHYSQNQYSRYTSPDSIPAYHPSYGYLSPPYSSTRSPTTEAIFASSPEGLGITQYRFEHRHEQHHLYAAHPEHLNPTLKSEHDLSITRGAVMPARYVPQSPYPASTSCSSYYSTPRHHYPPARHNPSMLARLAEGDVHGQTNYLDHSVASTRGLSDPIHFGYQPDPMQDGRWVVAALEVVHTMPDTRSDTLVWEHSGLQQYPYPDHLMNRYASDDSTVSTERCPSTLSTPPASQDGMQLQYPDVHCPAMLDVKVEVHKFETVKTELESPSMTNAVSPLRCTPKGTPKSKKATTRIHKPALQCRHCPKTFPKQSKLREHEKIHDPTPAACPEPNCNLVYGRQADLARHRRSKHRRDSFPCKFCLKRFNRSDITRRHEEQSCRVRKAEQASQGMIVHNNRSRI